MGATITTNAAAADPSIAGKGYVHPEVLVSTEWLAELLQREDLLFGSQRVKRGETPCLGVCAEGPILVVYPEGIWYSRVTPELLERIVVEHLKHGQPVEEAIFHRH